MPDVSHPMTESDPLFGYKRRSDLIARQVGMELCLYDPATGTLHILNPTAAGVWQHITPDRSTEAITHGFALSFRTEESKLTEIRNDIAKILNTFKAQNLILREGEVAPRQSEGSFGATLTIPDDAISAAPGGYAAPAMKTVGPGDLQTMFGLGSPSRGNENVRRRGPPLLSEVRKSGPIWQVRRAAPDGDLRPGGLDLEPDGRCGSANLVTRDVRILLLQLARKSGYSDVDQDVYAPIGVAYVGAALEAAGYNVQIGIHPPEPSSNGEGLQLPREFLSPDTTPNLFGVSATGNEIDSLLHLARMVKSVSAQLGLLPVGTAQCGRILC